MIVEQEWVRWLSLDLSEVLFGPIWTLSTGEDKDDKTMLRHHFTSKNSEHLFIVW